MSTAVIFNNMHTGTIDSKFLLMQKQSDSI
jgi:hypothetical protein